MKNILKTIILGTLLWSACNPVTEKKSSNPVDETKEDLINAILEKDTIRNKDNQLTREQLLLLSDSELQLELLKVIGAGSPYDKRACEAAEAVFTTKYNSLPQPFLKLNYDLLNSIIDYNAIKDTAVDVGFAVYPVLKNGKRTFVVFKAQTMKIGNCKDTITPMANQTGQIQFALLNETVNNFEVIDQDQFDQFQLDYRQATQYEGQPVESFYHPGGVFYNGNQLKKFYEDNLADSSFDIEFANISVTKKGANRQNINQDMELHSAILILNKGGRILKKGTVVSGQFKERAIDFGHLCPPDCH